MDNRVFKILKKLEPHGVGVAVDISPLLVEMFSDVDKTSIYSLRETMTIIYNLLEGMKADGYITTPSNYPSMSSNGGVYNWLDVSSLIVTLKSAGYAAIEEELKKGTDERLLESIIDTNNSVKDTNIATKNLYEIVIPNNNRLQRNMGYFTMGIAALSFLAIAFSAYFSYKGVTSENIRQLDTTLLNNTKVLHKMQQSQRGIDSSLQIMVKLNSEKNAASKK